MDTHPQWRLSRYLLSPFLRRTRLAPFGLMLACAVLAAPQVFASRYSLSFSEELRISQPIFVGVATKMTVTDAAPSNKRPTRPGSSPRRGRALEWRYRRLITFDIRVEEVLKSRAGHLPRNLTLKLMRGYARSWEINRDVEALRTQLINQPQVYLVSSDEHFTVKAIEEKERIITLLGKRTVKARKVIAPTDMVILQESEMPLQAQPGHGGQWLN